MAGSTMSRILTVLLCLGLFQGWWDQIQAGVPSKLSIWADPVPRVSKGSPVTIWCQGSLKADGYRLYKDRGSEPLIMRNPQASKNKTGFLIESMSSQNAGLYQCAYASGDTLSELSEPLLLVVTGEHSAPSLSAHPGPVVASGGNVSLVCSSESTSGPFHLLKEGGAEQPQHKESEWRSSERRWQAVFPVGPVSSSHAGTYRCYGSSNSTPNVWSQPSDPLHLEVTGVYREPSLSAQPGLLVLPGDSLTLQCRSEPRFDRFALTKDEGTTLPLHLNGQQSPNFPLGPVNDTHGGRYRCYSGHNLSYAWSAPSAPLDILVIGMSWKPSLLALPGPSVPWKSTVTLQCGSEVRADTFHLHREGSRDPPQQLRLQDTPAPSQANFTISPVTSGHHRIYRCYSSHSSSPFLLSQPSDPLELLVSGVLPQPSIWAAPGSIVSKRSPVTIWCQGSLQADGYILYKERNSEPWMTSIPEASIEKTGFLIQSMSSQNAGLYQCAYSTGGSLSQRSEPLLLVVTGEHSAPSLSAHPGPVVASGGNVSLVCSSESTWDTFHLMKEGGAEPPQHRKSERRSSERRWQAVFPVGPVSSSHAGTYRCYGSSNSTPNVWSQSSDPLHLEVTGLPLSLNVLIGVSVALVLLLSLLLFLFLYHRRQSRGRTSGDAAMKDPQPGQGVELDPQQNGPHDNSKEVTYAQVNCRSRLRQGMAASPSPLSEELLDTKGRQAEKDRQMDSQAAASADPQDVTYAQLTLMTRRQETSAPPSSPSEKPPEPSVYAALAVH